jgi:iron complex transport system substrate-binding protein
VYRPFLFLLAAALCLAQPRRIVSTAPAITEMLFAVGLGDSVVGVSNFCHYPPEAMTRKKIGTYIQPDLEAIAALRPSLVIIQNNPIQLASKLARLNLKVLEVDYATVPQIYSTLESIAAAGGNAEPGRALAARLRSELEKIRLATAKLPRRKIAFIVGRNPGVIEGLIAVGKGAYLSELVSIAGGENVFNDTSIPYPQISLESMLARNPDVIVDMGDMTQTKGVTEAHKKAVVSLWDKYPQLKAVREHRVFAVADDHFVVPGPRMIQAARDFARMLHPEVFR